MRPFSNIQLKEILFNSSHLLYNYIDKLEEKGIARVVGKRAKTYQIEVYFLQDILG